MNRELSCTPMSVLGVPLPGYREPKVISIGLKFKPVTDDLISIKLKFKPVTDDLISIGLKFKPDTDDLISIGLKLKPVTNDLISIVLKLKLVTDDFIRDDLSFNPRYGCGLTTYRPGFLSLSDLHIQNF
uniref:Uncharacterized protein n=1 Tax=Oryza punctata TaxID=4537 RepID=A0A0E0LYI6_ORYPU